MSYSNRSALSILLTLAAAGCADTTEPVDLDLGLDTQLNLRAGPFDNDLCLKTLAIGRTQGEACPKPAGWTVTEMFAFQDTNDADTERWCRFETEGAAGSSAQFDDYSDLVDVSQECIGVFAQTDLQSQIAEHLADSFRLRIGDMDLSQLDLPDGTSAEDARQTVAVGVVDTTPGWQGWKQADANSMHGVHMARIIDDIACFDSLDCDVVTESHLGLPRVPDHVNSNGYDLNKGGFGGTHGDFATGIYNAVEAWKTTHGGLTPSDGDRVPLVLNLSAGWETDLVGLVGGSEPARVLAVRSALEYASCHGALIIAAVGNDAEHCTDGPLAPAAWENDTAPSPTYCEDHYGVTSTVPVGDPGRPLVYGVSGLGEVNEMMPGSRTGANAPIAAPAMQVVAGNDAYTTPLTGTSVAAAAASGVAALVWSFDPSMTPDRVMEVLYTSGGPISDEAGVELEVETPVGSAQTQVRRIHACRAVQRLCNDAAGCNFNFGCSPDYGEQELQDAFDIVANANATTAVTLTGLPTETECMDALTCFDFDATGLDDPCSATDDNSLDAYVFPQPPDPPCPVCALNGEVLTGSRHSAYNQDTVEAVTLVLKDASATTKIDLTGSFMLPANETSRVEINHPRVTNFTGTATIQVKFANYPRVVSNALVRRWVGP